VVVATFVAVSALLCVPVALASRKGGQKVEPDYTKGEKLTAKNSQWALGSTGASGNLWGAGQDNQTGRTRTIQIVDIEKGTPADGKLMKNDVILGVKSPQVGPDKKAPSGHFSWDAAKALSAAITEAEKNANGGKLVLNIWRKSPSAELSAGKTGSVTLTLPVKGSYSATSPWKCKKTKAIIDAAAQSIVKKGFYSTNRKGTKKLNAGVNNVLDAMGLLATGEAKYMPTVRNFARALGRKDLKLDVITNPVSPWHGSYQNLFLCEYYLATKDEYVLHAINEYSDCIAKGVSGVGTWSHGMANVKENGMYGPPCAYGAMNQCSETCALSLIMAKKCGVKNKFVDEAVWRAVSFLRWYVDKGCIPYGDHAPAHYHDNNGRNSQAAVIFDIVGDKDAADYFTRMTLASYNGRERGHTGHFFSYQWGALGAARGGAEAAHSFIKNTRWFTELERRADGGSVYQYQLAGVDHGKYKNWSTTGSRLLQHCLPRKQLYITGKGGSSFAPIRGAALKTVVDTATFNPSGRSVKELLAALGNWSLIVREAAAKELGKRDENVVKEMIAMLDSPNRYARYGACVGLRFAGRWSTAAVDTLVDKVKKDTDMTLRFFAVNSLVLPRKGEEGNGLGYASKKAGPALLKLAAIHDPQQDATRKMARQIAEVLFYGGRVQKYTGFYPNGTKTEKLDRSVLLPAMKAFLVNPNGAARSNASSVFEHLSKDDLKELWGDIYHATKDKAPSGVMFAGAMRSNGIKIMAKNHIKEGLPIGVHYVFEQSGWGNFQRKRNGIPALEPYGMLIEPYFPKIETIIKQYKGKKKKDSQRDAVNFVKVLVKMKKTPAPKLVSIQTYIKNKSVEATGSKK